MSVGSGAEKRQAKWVAVSSGCELSNLKNDHGGVVQSSGQASWSRPLRAVNTCLSHLLFFTHPAGRYVCHLTALECTQKQAALPPDSLLLSLAPRCPPVVEVECGSDFLSPTSALRTRRPSDGIRFGPRIPPAQRRLPVTAAAESGLCGSSPE